MEHLELFGPIAESVQMLELKLPDPSVDHVIAPIGELGAVTLVSVTVAVHVDNWPTTTGEPHNLLVVVESRKTDWVTEAA